VLPEHREETSYLLSAITGQELNPARENFPHAFKAGPAARQRPDGHRDTGLTLQARSTIAATPDGRQDSAGTRP
jgi:hypothetical protein